MGTLVEYIWIDKKGNLRSKSRYLKCFLCELKDIPEWNFDGNSTGQAFSEDAEIVIKPKAMFTDPFRPRRSGRGDAVYPHKLVLCDTYKPDGAPCKDNNRVWAKEIFDRALEEEPWFGLEQEYFLIDPVRLKPLGFCGETTEPKKQGQYYCSTGFENNFGREIVEEHLMACLTAGIKISGINSEVAPGQWEFQIGPCVGIEEGDHLWVARYLLQRIGEKHKVIVNFDPKPIKADWNGSGCHTNYSTKNMRSPNGIKFIDEAIQKLSKKHKEHMKLYGEGNDLRMTGEHETASYDVFTDGIANRGASIRRGNKTVKKGCGYFEDRRPSSNCDPYLVTGIIFKTTVLDKFDEDTPLS